MDSPLRHLLNAKSIFMSWLWSVFNKVNDWVPKTKISLSPENINEEKKSFIFPPIKPLLEVYLYHVLNPDEFLRNITATPKLAQIGPFVYSQKFERTEPNWNIKNQTIKYGVRKTYFFHEDLSVANEDLKITTLNLPVLSSLAQMVYGKKDFIF